MSFAEDVQKFAEKTGQNASETAVATLQQLNRLVVKRTPVDTGQARGGWIASVGSVSLSASGKKDKTGESTIQKANSQAENAPGSVYYLINNVNHIAVLEYGGYPTPVKRGSWDKKSKSYKIKSTNGYSQQAPSGILRVSLMEIGDYMQSVINGL